MPESLCGRGIEELGPGRGSVTAWRRDSVVYAEIMINGFPDGRDARSPCQGGFMFDPARGYPSVVIYLRYADPRAALRWLGNVLGAREAVRLTLPHGRIGHAKLVIGNSVLSLGLATKAPAPVERVSRHNLRAMTLVFVENVNQAVHRALHAGRCLIDEATDQPWGMRQAIVADPKGYLWELSVHLRDVPLSSWGAIELSPLPG